MKAIIEKREWKEFQEAGLLWWVNRIIHLFGWAIVLELNNGEIVGCYPARVPYRGFSEECEVEGFIKLSRFVERESTKLRRQAEQ